MMRLILADDATGKCIQIENVEHEFHMTSIDGGNVYYSMTAKLRGEIVKAFCLMTEHGMPRKTVKVQVDNAGADKSTATSVRVLQFNKRIDS